MRTIIAGGRNIDVYQLVIDAVEESQFQITTVISGGARERNIPLEIFNADWNTHGRAAGHIRNRQMADNADALIAVWDGKSKGTRNMIETAKKLGLKVHVKLTVESCNRDREQERLCPVIL